MVKKKELSLHRIQNIEHSAFCGRPLGDFEKGEVVVRHGTPCMVVTVSPGMTGLLGPDAGTVWLVNLVNGSVWQCSAKDQVHPAFNIKLDYSTARTGD